MSSNKKSKSKTVYKNVILYTKNNKNIFRGFIENEGVTTRMGGIPSFFGNKNIFIKNEALNKKFKPFLKHFL